MMANKPKGTLYTGVTRNLLRRVHQHKEEYLEGFTKKYKCHHLVYFEIFSSIVNAIRREKEIKSFLRYEKIELIEKLNPLWVDLYPGLF